MMTPAERIVAIRARRDKVTPGTWHTGEMGAEDSWWVYSGHYIDGTLAKDLTAADAELIASAPADLTWLADLAEHYRAGLERIGGDPNDGDDRCLWCREELDPAEQRYWGLTVHIPSCPWRQAREALETAP